MKARNNRLVDELFWTKKMVDCQKYYSRLPTEELILMSVDQERARARDDRLAHEVLPETRLRLMKANVHIRQLQKELDDRRELDTFEVNQQVEL